MLKFLLQNPHLVLISEQKSRLTFAVLHIWLNGSSIFEISLLIGLLFGSMSHGTFLAYNRLNRLV